MAAPMPPGVGVLAPPVPTMAQLKTFTEYYNDASVDEFHGAYAAAMSVFTAPGNPAVTPANIRELITNDSRNSSMGYALHMLLPTNPNQPGLIYGVHSVSKYLPRFGFPASPWDNVLFASVHEVVGNQITATVQFPADAFTRVGQGNIYYRVPTSQLIDAEYLADPNVVMLGPYVNGDADTELIQCRNVVGIPYRYMRHFIPSPLSPRAAWEIVAADITANGDTVTCAPLLNFLRLACTLNAVGDTAAPFDVPLSDDNLIHHRTILIEHKLPGLNQTPTMADVQLSMAAGQAIAASVSELATEQRAYRQDMADRHAVSTKKTVESYFGAGLPTLMRYCNVRTAVDLPPVYQALADHGHKSHRNIAPISLEGDLLPQPKR
jgi:hypothetical protein